MILSIIVAVAENQVIGNNNDLIWHISADLKHFKQLTSGHTVVMGRKTFESIGKPLPNRRNIVISRNPDFHPEGCEMALSIEEALRLAENEEEVFIIGGGTIYREMWDKADRLYLTLVHTVAEGDTSVPAVDPKLWQLVERQDFKAGEKDDFDYSFVNYRRGHTPYSISVILSTYNQKEWLEKALWGYEAQSVREFEVVIADDGSRQDTFEMIERMRSQVSYPIKHVWQEDRGFRKCEILNKAILVSEAEYLLFSDGDCIPRRDFVETHLNYRRKGRFLSGGYHKLPEELSKAITWEDILAGRCFEKAWLMARGMKSSFRNNKLTSWGFKAWLLNTFTTAKASWNGCNSSGWREDVLAVNGFDERMQYGGQDREFGERLGNKGISGKQIRYSAICVHLDHARGYKTDESIRRNLNIRKHTRRNRVTWTPYGIVK